MRQGQIKKRMLRVKRKFESDRLSPTNLQAAYERVLPAWRYRIISLERKCETQHKNLDWVAEVAP
jgi:uncharacterized membrane protein